MLTNPLRRATARALLIALIGLAMAGHTPRPLANPLQPVTARAAPSASANRPAASAAERPEIAIERAQEFAYLLRRPDNRATSTIVLLHGSGGDEASLMSLAETIDPDALLLGVRGRVRQEGVNRWYRRLTSTSFDQQDVRAEAEAFATFLSAAAAEHELDLEKAIFLGYSNGANLIGALTLLHPGLVHRAVLLRAMPVLDAPPETGLGAADILTIAGSSDRLYSPFAPDLERLFRSRGARVKSYMVDADHGIGDEDARLVRDWLALAE